MKILKLFCIALLFLSASCNKSSDIFTNYAIVDEDCTGTYLTIGNDHYKVCEPLIFPFKKGKKVKMTYYRIDECKTIKDGPKCLLFHEFDSYIRVIAAHLE